MNGCLAVCLEEMTRLSKEIKRLNQVLVERNDAKEYENALEAQKALNVTSIKLQTIADLVDKMCKCGNV